MGTHGHRDYPTIDLFGLGRVGVSTVLGNSDRVEETMAMEPQYPVIRGDVDSLESVRLVPYFYLLVT